MKIIDVIDYFRPKLGYQKTSLIKEQMSLEHELYGYYSAVDVVVWLSSLTITTLESMSRGLPITAGNEPLRLKGPHLIIV